MKKKKEKTSLLPEQKVVRRCLIMQCFAIGAWLMMILVVALVGFPFSSAIGTYSIYIVCVFSTVGIIEVCGWEKRIVACRPEVTCIKQSSEKLNYVHKVTLLLMLLGWLALLSAAVLMIFFHKEMSGNLINIYLTDLPLCAIGLAWLIQCAFFVYDAVTLHLWMRSEKFEDEEIPAEVK
ncbi:MAG: hypothetical protein MJ085_05990 [Clostridia bacterium]|nr:hypothetical protein [Clostridia bacterium]